MVGSVSEKVETEPVVEEGVDMLKWLESGDGIDLSGIVPQGSVSEENTFLWEQLKRESEAKRNVLEVMKRREEDVRMLTGEVIRAKRKLLEREAECEQKMESFLEEKKLLEEKVEKSRREAEEERGRREEAEEARRQEVERVKAEGKDRWETVKVEKDKVLKGSMEMRRRIRALEEENRQLKLRAESSEVWLNEAKRDVEVMREDGRRMRNELEDERCAKRESNSRLEVMQGKVGELEEELRRHVLDLRESNEEVIRLRLGELAPIQSSPSTMINLSALTTTTTTTTATTAPTSTFFPPTSPQQPLTETDLTNLEEHADRLAERFESILRSYTKIFDRTTSLILPPPADDPKIATTMTAATTEGSTSGDSVEHGSSPVSPILYRRATHNNLTGRRGSLSTRNISIQGRVTSMPFLPTSTEAFTTK